MAGLSGSVIALTGGGSGLGLGLAQHFREQGAKLALFDISAEKEDALRNAFGDEILRSATG